MFTIVRLYAYNAGTPPATRLLEQWVASSVYYDKREDAIAVGPDPGPTGPRRFRVLQGADIVYDSADQDAGEYGQPLKLSPPAP